ncbi:hypothetical protein [Collinsella intestinalis]|uniref:hypothetical protein n=1 Tax=Collinsella intestinalis TaxID=147207 RepID=UPI00195AB758|nr:hypothetical protein [Collinsella intestinalis]MBM6941554.1 hypothetical protein [Collinsella intestinalis]
MNSIQDVANSAYRIKDAAAQLQRNTEVCASSLDRRTMNLQAVVRGSRTGENAVREVQAAAKAVREASANLLTLQTDVDQFIRELTK